jgi:long-subunit acyl-CoA synthetase (AMP-forming)
MLSSYHSNLENFLHWVSEKPNDIFLKQPIGPSYIDFSYQESGAIVKKIANFLKNNLKDGPKHIGILSKTIEQTTHGFTLN